VGAVDLDVLAARAAARVAARRRRAGLAARVDARLRSDGPELLDLDSTPASVKAKILEDVERITRLFALDRYWMWRIGKLIEAARAARGGKPVRVLDVGAGSGGLLFGVARWAARRRVPVELAGVDYGEEAVERARRAAAAEGLRVSFVHGDARDLAHVDTRGVDVAVTTFMLHHLPPGDAARVLAELDRVAASGVFAFDLRRNLPALPPLWAALRLGRFEAPSRHDTIMSVRRGYTAAELGELIAAGGLELSVRHLPPAFVEVRRAG
jgi:ubiquinone/menaquinone biosynthesis C-methylase UbiE